jgi:LDH2 family malate/lactate/ureidoglycolate dehydrogenase
MNFQYTQLQEFIQQVFLSIGCSEEDALLASQVLISAD